MGEGEAMAVIRSALSALIATAVLAGGAAAATRSCDGWYEIAASLVDGAPPAKARLWRLGDFIAFGRCGNTEPSRCREIARQALFRCYQEHYAGRASGARPEICREVQGYAIDDLDRAIARAACCARGARSHGRVVVALTGVVSGVNACVKWSKRLGFKELFPYRELLAPAQEIDCESARRDLC